MAAFMNGLLIMNIRGITIILIVMAFRFLLKRLGVGHKYIVGLWLMAFLFFVVPWKVSLPVGFWGNVTVLDGMWQDADMGSDMDGNDSEMDGGSSGGSGGNRDGKQGDGSMGNSVMGSSVNYMGNSPMSSDLDHVGNTNTQGSTDHAGEPKGSNNGILGDSATGFHGVMGAAAGMPADPDHENQVMPDGAQENVLLREKVMNILAALWLAGLCAGFGHMLYSCLALKRKLALSIPYRENIRWAENIDMPMVFGPIHPKIYLPFSLEDENLSYVIRHEEMHVKRKDGLFKMAAYVICLVHWFDPLLWIAYLLLGSDLEKACDEEVIQGLEKENRKEYAYALVHIASRGRKKKRKVFVAPVGFAEGNLKSRVKNVMKYKYTLPGLGAAVIVVTVALSVLFMTEAKEPEQSPGEGILAGQNGAPGNTDGNGGTEGKEVLAGNTGSNGSEGSAGNADSDGHGGAESNGDAGNGEQGQQPGDSGQEESALPVFYVQNLDSLAVKEPFSIEDCYITNRWAADNHYYIDEEGVFWGVGRNDYGQFGTGTYGVEEYYEEPVKIAEHVVSMDVSGNSYFCIYLTENGELYGMGLNCGGILLGKGSETVGQTGAYQKVTKPVLLMTDVAYARAGRENIVALKTDGSAYWWGQYSSTTLSHVPNLGDFWSLDEDSANPAKMYVCEPRKIMDDCIYIATGTYTGAVINEAGELYVWGLNLFGQCGVPVTEDDYIREPVKVMDHVKMVWMEEIAFNDPEAAGTYHTRLSSRYSYNVFLLTEDDTLMAAGLDLGDKEKVTNLTGDLQETHTHRYGDSFVPVRAVEYSPELYLRVLRELEFGMSMEEAEKALNDAGQSVFRTTTQRSYLSDEEGECLCAEYSQYLCVFDERGGLESIRIQESGSRDGRFTLGMSFSELKDVIEGAGGELAAESDNVYVYVDSEQHTRYEFYVRENVLNVVWERVI